MNTNVIKDNTQKNSLTPELITASKANPEAGNVAAYVKEMSKELIKLSKETELNLLAYLLEMVFEDASDIIDREQKLESQS